MTLKENKRIEDNNNDKNLKKWLLNMGNWKFSSTFENEQEVLELLKEILSIGNLIDEIYENEMISCENSLMNESIILAPKNANVNELNKKILQKFNRPTKEYLNVDSAEDENNENLNWILSLGFLNSLSPNGLPQHKLQFKIGAVNKKS